MAITSKSEGLRTETYRTLHVRLAAVRRKDDIAKLIHGVATCGLVCIVVCLSALVGEEIFRFTVVPRTVIFDGLVVLAAFLFIWRVGLPWARILGILPEEDDLHTARKVGSALPHLKDRLGNTLQLCLATDVGELYSRELLDAAIEDTLVACEGIDFTSTISFSGSRQRRRIFAASILTSVCLFVLFPTMFFGAAYRLLHFNEAFAAPVSFRFVVDPGNKEVVKGESVPVRIRVEGAAFDEISIAFREEGQLHEEDKLVSLGPDGDFRYELKSLKETVYYAPQAGGVRGEEDTLTVVDRPVIKLLRLNLTPPAYSGLPEKRLDDNVGDVNALKGTIVHVEIEANRELREGKIAYNDGETWPLSIAGTKGLGIDTLMKEHAYHIDLLDNTGIASADPVEYAMKILPDANPTISLLLPADNLDVTDSTPINLLIKIADDYGFSTLRLGYKLVQSRYEDPAQTYTFVLLPLPASRVTQALIPYRWHIGNLHLVPEDVISYFVEVFDNDAISGPKAARSGNYLLRLPSLDEVFAEADKGHEMSIQEMQHALVQAGEAHQELEDLKRSLQTNQEKLDWQDRQKSEDLLKRYENVRGKLDTVKKALEKLTENLQRNNVLSKETAEKYQELQQLMDQLSLPELADAMKKLQEALQQMSPDAIKQAMSQMTVSEENLRRGIERTLNLLRRIQIEQKMDEAARRAEEMVKKQEEVEKNTEQTKLDDRARINKLAQDQRRLLEQLTALRLSMDTVQKKMGEFPAEMPLTEMAQAQKDIQESALENSMEQAAQSLQQMDSQRAQEMEKQAAKAGAQLARHLREMQQSMRQSQQRQIVNAMRLAMRDMLDLSHRQEDLKDATQKLDPNSGRFRDDAQTQMEIIHDLGTVTEKLGELSKKTFGVTPEIGKSIGDALREMANAMQSIEQRNKTSTAEHQTDAMGSLNEATQRVEDAMNAIEQSGGQGLGMAGLMQRLQRMALMQQQINNGTRNLGGMSAEQAAEMSRLASEQSMVRKSLEELAREAAAAGNLKRLLGDLTDLAKDMTEVQTDLIGSNVSPKTVSKEERILSRLLDAQRSTRERDFEKQRSSKTGENIVGLPPPPIDVSTLEGRDRLRRDMQKALEEGYAREFEDVIKRYFDVLEQVEPHAK